MMSTDSLHESSFYAIEYSDGWGNSVTLQVHWINNYSINVQATWSFSEIDDGNYRLKCENKTVLTAIALAEVITYCRWMAKYMK